MGLSDFKAAGCNLCGSDRSKVLFRSGSYPKVGNGDVVRCRQCGLIYRYSPTAYSKRDPESGHKPDYPDPCTTGRMRMFDHYVQLISPLRKYNRILDVGAGRGSFLHLCSQHGWNVWGVEADKESADFVLKEYGLQVFHGSLEEARYPDNFFDVVTLWNVLEHILDPGTTLKEVNRVLRPGGAMFVRFPNAAFHVTCRRLFAKAHRLWEFVGQFDHCVIHLYAFSRATILRYLWKNDFAHPEVQNAWSTLALYDFRESGMRKVMGIVTRAWAELVNLASRGHWLIAPSLLAKGIKPSRLYSA